MRYSHALLFSMVCFLTSAMADASTVDRWYRFGDEGTTGTLDSAGEFDGSGNPIFDQPEVLSFANLGSVLGTSQPTYAAADDRPDLPAGSTGNMAASFDGDRDMFGTVNLNFPQSSFSSVLSISDAGAGPYDYSGVSDRYLQFWVKPANATSTQVLVNDTQQHGVRIHDGKFSMRYAETDFDSDVEVEVGRGNFPGTNVDSNGWYHIMLLTQDNLYERGSATLYVDGVAVAAIAGDYQIQGEVVDTGTTLGEPVVIDDYPLSIGGGARARNVSGTIRYLVREADYFEGLIDELEMGVIGFNRNDEWGEFDFATENQFAREIAFNGVDPADVNLDGIVAGDGTGPASSDDVTAFVENFFYEKTIDSILAGGDADERVPVRVGDVTTRALGDLNVDGIIDLADWSILNAADPSMGSLVLNKLGVSTVPEPASCVSLACMLTMLGFAARRFR
ncbi:LamG domain-containing protein [Aeoliella mucimassa]|uniref:LamG-like jellyroll fold domain-containing protein n=1 Tax=Aeoliella mucimassa TaxID=2527972 RepID=A0A518AVC7_9BACT|nr:LamG domain-containing protein [Aeoliella mucimassa]QDU58689.1 hypothetical protein Pan181_49290 [Aeoliella mucimassa]